MDSFRRVLRAHLDGGIEQLGADNMRKFWMKEDMKRFGQR
jgi:hypothetical protein